MREKGPTDEARARLAAAEELMAHAAEAAGAREPQRASELVGRGSDAIGSALYHLREAMRARGAQPARSKR